MKACPSCETEDVTYLGVSGRPDEELCDEYQCNVCAATYQGICVDMTNEPTPQVLYINDYLSRRYPGCELMPSAKTLGAGAWWRLWRESRGRTE